MKPFVQFFTEGRPSIHHFTDPKLTEAYWESYEIFKDLGFETASTFAIWDFIYRLLPDHIKTEEVQMMKRKHYGSTLRKFIVNFINASQMKIDKRQLIDDMKNVEMVREYLHKQDHGNRRRGKLDLLSRESGREIVKDF
jgi:hypothetical protein